MVVATNPPYGLMVAFMQGTYTIFLIILFKKFDFAGNGFLL